MVLGVCCVLGRWSPACEREGSDGEHGGRARHGEPVHAELTEVSGDIPGPIMPNTPDLRRWTASRTGLATAEIPSDAPPNSPLSSWVSSRRCVLPVELVAAAWRPATKASRAGGGPESPRPWGAPLLDGLGAGEPEARAPTALPVAAASMGFTPSTTTFRPRSPGRAKNGSSTRPRGLRGSSAEGSTSLGPTAAKWAAEPERREVKGFRPTTRPAAALPPSPNAAGLGVGGEETDDATLAARAEQTEHQVGTGGGTDSGTCVRTWKKQVPVGGTEEGSGGAADFQAACAGLHERG